MSQPIKFSQTITAKILFMSLLIIFLIIPSVMVGSLVKERKNRQREAKTEVSAKWGKEQELVGPILEIPYRVKVVTEKNDKEGKIQKEYSFVTNKEWINLENFDLKIDLNPEIRKRGIFEVILYRANLVGNGMLAPVMRKETNREILWDEAKILIGLSDLHGLKNHPKITWNDKIFEMEVSEKNNREGAILSTQLPNLKAGGTLSFAFDVQGSEQIHFTPSAKTTNVEMNSDWTNPSFIGRHLPEKHNISEKGFSAHWELQNFGNSEGIEFLRPHELLENGTGVKLLFPVDFYQKNERAVKYNILFIVLTFVAFFLLEILRKHRVHPIQYSLIGFAMILFYALLLSFSEHFSFFTAYAISAGSIMALISGYCLSVLKNKKSAGIILGLLFGVYSYLYVLLQLQDYALLSGTIFLFLVLSIVMFLTRKIDWYEIKVNGK